MQNIFLEKINCFVLQNNTGREKLICLKIFKSLFLWDLYSIIKLLVVAC